MAAECGSSPLLPAVPVAFPPTRTVMALALVPSPLKLKLDTRLRLATSEMARCGGRMIVQGVAGPVGRAAAAAFPLRLLARNGKPATLLACRLVHEPGFSFGMYASLNWDS